jgi:lysophospholipase L1-like esterase
VSGRVAIALLSALLTMFALDRGIAFFDLAYTPTRGRPNDVRHIERAEFSVDVRLNALGFRERRLPSPKPPGVLRVVALGDSFTQGYGVEEHEAWPRRLETLLDAHGRGRYEVVNLGIPGTNPRDYISQLRDPGLAYQPDVVLVTVMGNDVQDRWVQREFGVQFASGVLVSVRQETLAPSPTWTRIPRAVFPALYPYVWDRLHTLRAGPSVAQAAHTRAPGTAASTPSATGGAAGAILLALAERYGRREAIEDALATMPANRLDDLRPVLEGTVPLDADGTDESYLRVMALVEPRLLADAVLLPQRYDAAWDDVQRDLGRIFALARSAGARPVLIFAPGAQQVTTAARPYLESLGFEWDDRTLTDTTFADRLRALARSEDVTFVDLLPVLRARRDDGLYFPRDGHWTPAGNALVAHVVAHALERAEADDSVPAPGPAARRRGREAQAHGWLLSELWAVTAPAIQAILR